MRITREQIMEQARKDRIAHNALPTEVRQRYAAALQRMDYDNKALRESGRYDQEKL